MYEQHGDVYADAYYDNLEAVQERGACVLGVWLVVRGQLVQASWRDDGRSATIKVGEKVLVSRTHPLVDAMGDALVVTQRSHRSFMLQAPDKLPDDISAGTWRLDLEPDLQSYERMHQSVRSFVAREPFPLQSLVVAALDRATCEELCAGEFVPLLSQPLRVSCFGLAVANYIFAYLCRFAVADNVS